VEQLYPGVYQHETARVYGDVEIGEGSSLWINAAIRSEMHSVRIGAYTNIQDFVMIHVGARTSTLIGDYCSIAHHAVVHGATIGNNCLVGVGAIVMDGCVIGDNSIIGAAAYLAPGARIPRDSIVQGNPGVVVKRRNNFVVNRMNAIYYNINAEHYQRGEYRAWASEVVKQQMKWHFRALSEAHRAANSTPSSEEDRDESSDG
jgi:carbonic anhydrase/acetyltransferase-like protein (isoleucine patch superfamily)